MEPILRTIAKAYTQRYSDLKRFCFIFPNKRCGIYLKKFLAEQGKKSEEMPHILTISEFVSLIAKKTEATRIIQLFTLFNAYKEAVGHSGSIDFDAFRGWGEIILSDFNTVDINLADPEEIFKNVKDYREITSNFLTEQQKEVMKEYFGVEADGDTSEFWKTFDDPDNISEIKKKFLNLWQILYPLHEKFIDQLSAKGLGSAGSIYREAAYKIKERGKEILPYKKIIAVGFNALSESERSIFTSLQNETDSNEEDTFIDFIWDATGPVLNNKDISASRFVDYNKKHFPMPEWLTPFLSENEVMQYPEIEIVSAPSVTAQTKVAAKLLKDYTVPEKRKLISDAEIALVLPDESLLPNILYSLPDGIGDINLTMGYSMKLAPVSSFMSLIRRLYAGVRETKKGLVFFTKDLRMLFSHPYSYLLFESQGIESVLDYISQYHKIRLNLNEIEEFLPDAGQFLSFPSKESDDTSLIFNQLRNLLNRLISKLSEDDPKPEENQDISQIKIYSEYVDSLEEAIRQFGISSSSLSIMQLVDRLVSTEKIGFEGEPLIGLQVMGTLETRSLDFKHVIILSMNEGIMPRKAIVSTFIPETLRKAYGLPPARYAEEIFSYYFYRLISRCEKVTLIYDGRTISGMRGGESRYLLQLRQFVPNGKIHEEAWQYILQTLPSKDSSIKKTPEIMEMARAFSDTGKNSKNFSASSLNTYRECQVKFFLRYLLNINPDPEKGDYLDAITIGNVLHNVMMQLYLSSNLQKKLLTQPVVITKEFLNTLLSDSGHIKKLVENNIQEMFYGNKDGTHKEIESGVNEIISEQIVELVKDIISYDLNLAPFNLYGCEISEILRIKLDSGRVVNFRFAIDRLDEINYNGEKRLRIVDYKTGSRKRKAQNLDEVFNGGYGSEQIFQLFTYAWLLGKVGMKGWEDVMTEIYFVPDLIKGEGGLPELDKKKVDSFRPYMEEFSSRIDDLIESVFIDEKFTDCPDAGSCSYCAFRNFCEK